MAQNLLADLMNRFQGGVAQVNPFDGGANYQSVTQPYDKQKRMAEHRAFEARYNAANPQPQGGGGPQLHPGTASGRDIDYIRGPVPQNTPFRMFEDGTFEGNPNMFLSDNPGYKFYEDNSFSAPRPQNIQYEDGSGFLNGQQYGAMDSFGDIPRGVQTPYQREAASQPRLQQDPMAELRRFLGL